MSTHARSPLSPAHGCKRDRLAEGALAAVDVCGCGVMQLHVGALSLRLPPEAMTDLVDTLTRALERHGTPVASPPAALVARHRGQA